MVRERLKQVEGLGDKLQIPATWVIPENKLQSALTDFYVLLFHISNA